MCTDDPTENPRKKEAEKTVAKHPVTAGQGKPEQGNKELKRLLYDQKQTAIQNFLGSLTATEATEYSLWKDTKRVSGHKRPFPTKN
jgi:hypothetical protein